MGICAMCSAKPLTKEAREKKLRPLLLDLEKSFFEHSGEDKSLDIDELATLWKAESLKRTGKLTDEDMFMIEAGASEIFRDMDVDNTGKVSYHEFVMHSMGGVEVRAGLRDLRQKLFEETKRNPNKLQELVEQFKRWDFNGDGFITDAELQMFIEALRAGCSGGPGGKGCLPVCGAPQPPEVDGRELEQAIKLKEELLSVVDADDDGKVDLWELAAHAMGRRKTPVELILYDISKGATEWAGPLLFGSSDVEAFHSSLHIFGSEYWYGGKVFRNDPPSEKQFGMPISESKHTALKVQTSEVRPDLHVVRLGYTLATHEEFLAFLRSKVIDRYTGIEKYDLLTHSCNHFSDECLHFLLGRGVPDEVLELQHKFSSPGFLALRPYLNKVLGGFSTEGGGGDQLLEDSKIKPVEGKIEPTDVLGAGTVVVLDGGTAGIDSDGSRIIATIVSEKDGICSVKYMDGSSKKVCTKSGVPAKAILKRMAGL